MSDHSKSDGNLHYVYFIREVGTHYVKIGYSNDPTVRRGNLQSGNPRELEVLFAIQLTDELIARRIEKTYHTRYEKSHVLNEWYILSDADLQDVRISVEIANEAAKAERKRWQVRYAREVARLRAVFQAGGVFDFDSVTPAWVIADSAD